jgi:hypothetical protein
VLASALALTKVQVGLSRRYAHSLILPSVFTHVLVDTTCYHSPHSLSCLLASPHPLTHSPRYVYLLQPCVAGKASQAAVLDSASGHLHIGGETHCLDCFNNQGPNVFVGGCKVPGQGDDNQKFFPYAKGPAGMIQTALGEKVGVDNCLTVRSPPLGSALYVTLH